MPIFVLMCTFQDTPLIQGARKQFYLVLKVKLYFLPLDFILGLFFDREILF